jgi:UDP-N-acetylmuramoyl-L-alanyl-D-glutamate--2,6-diaminopimelate ligase
MGPHPRKQPECAALRLTELTGRSASRGPDPEIVGIASDSRKVAAGYLFAALPGAAADGRAFIADAIGRGAVAVLAPTGTHVPVGVAVVTDDEPRHRLALAAAKFYGAQPEIVCAVTGTNGKTSVAAFARQLWAALGRRAASIGTLGIVAPGGAVAGALTTPDPVALHATLAELAADGVDRLALEASSHGIAQSRLDGVRLAAAAFTNLTRDHLDYHADMASYRAAKLRLFDALLPKGGVAVLNADSPEFGVFAATCRRRGQRVVGYGETGDAIRLDAIAPRAHGSRVRFTIGGKRFKSELALVGGFQAMNALCALGLVMATGEDVEDAAGALENLVGARGRLELAATHPSGAPIYVDYAHTPDALENVLNALRPHTDGRLVVVFGCGGDRDRGKRPQMGRIAHRLADMVIVTDDNPRGEDPAAIRAEIMPACPGAREIGDRAEAIYAAAAGLKSGDVLVLAGKGHETGQIVGATVRPFDDAAVARAAVAALSGQAT